MTHSHPTILSAEVPPETLELSERKLRVLPLPDRGELWLRTIAGGFLSHGVTLIARWMVYVMEKKIYEKYMVQI